MKRRITKKLKIIRKIVSHFHYKVHTYQQKLVLFTHNIDYFPHVFVKKKKFPSIFFFNLAY